MATHPTIRQQGQALVTFVREVALRFTKERVPLSAGAISFFTLLSLIPLMLLVISVATYVVPYETAQREIENLAAAFGPQIAEVLRVQFFTVVENRGLLTGFALLVVFWVGSQIFLILESALNLTWGSTRRRPFWARRLLAFLMVVVVGSLLALAVVLTNAIRLLRSIPQWQDFLTEISPVISLITSFILPTLLIATLFAILYRVLPTKPVTLRSVLPGALLAAVVWEVTVHLFGWYVSHINNFTFIYGSFGGLVLLMLWLFYSAEILLLGAEISAVYHEHLVQAGDEEEKRVDTAVDDPPKTKA